MSCIHTVAGRTALATRSKRGRRHGTIFVSCNRRCQRVPELHYWMHICPQRSKSLHFRILSTIHSYVLDGERYTQEGKPRKNEDGNETWGPPMMIIIEAYSSFHQQIETPLHCFVSQPRYYVPFHDISRPANSHTKKNHNGKIPYSSPSIGNRRRSSIDDSFFFVFFLLLFNPVIDE